MQIAFAPRVAALFARIRRVENLGALLAVTACGWFALVCLWGLFALHTKGHLGSGAVVHSMIGENCFRWSTFYPSWGFYTAEKPGQNDWMCSHPYGVYWLGGLMATMFKHRDFAVPLPAVIMSICTPPLLYFTVKDRWGSVAAAATSWGFACLPITMAFARFQSMEVLSMFGCVLFLFGHMRYQATGKAVYLVASLAGVVVACFADWPGYLMIGPVLGWSLLRAHVLPARWSPALAYRRYARWWALSATVGVLAFMTVVALLYHGDRIACWLSQANLRTGVNESLAAALFRRRTWIDLSFTPPAILLGKIGAGVGVLRLLLIRRDEEVFGPAVLLAATTHYCVFKQAADVHPFWSHYFGLYFAFAFGQLVATFMAGIRLAGRWLTTREVGPTMVDVAGGLAVAVALVVILPDGIRGLRYWRSTGGNYGLMGNMADDFVYVLRNVVRPKLDEKSALVAHKSTMWSAEHTWAVTRSPEEVTEGPQKCEGRPCFWIARASELKGAEWTSATSTAHIAAYGDIWLANSSERKALLEARSLNEREPGWLEWWLVTPTGLMRSISKEPDPFATWELRRHVGQAADNGLPDPSSLDETRVAYNAAVDRVDGARASRLRRSIEDQIDPKLSAEFGSGVHLLGTRMMRGAAPTLEMWFEAREKLTDDLRFVVTSRMVARATMSFIPVDSGPQSVVVAPPIPTSLWVPGFIYRLSVPIQHRPGVEQFSGAWQGTPAPQRIDGQPSTALGEYR